MSSDDDVPAPSPSAAVLARRASREAKSMREESKEKMQWWMAGKEKENMKRKGKQRLVGEMAIRWIAIVHFCKFSCWRFFFFST